MDEEISSAEARNTLLRAASSASAVRSRARWMSTYLIVFGIGFACVTLLLGLVQPLALKMAVFSAGWPALIAIMVIWSRRQPATLARTGRRVAKYWIMTGVLYGLALVIGLSWFTGRWGYWLPAALAVALPMVLGGVAERRA